MFPSESHLGRPTMFLADACGDTVRVDISNVRAGSPTGGEEGGLGFCAEPSRQENKTPIIKEEGTTTRFILLSGTTVSYWNALQNLSCVLFD